jgi:hypothetical protein
VWIARIKTAFHIPQNVLVALVARAHRNTYCMNRCATERGEKWNKTTLFRLCAGVNINLHSRLSAYPRAAEMDIC